MCLNRFDVFWAAHEKSKSTKPFYSEDFKDFMQKMLALDPKDRLTIEGIRAHPWYNGKTDDLSTIQAEFKKRKTLVDSELKKQKEQREKEKLKKTQVGGGAFTGFRAYRDGEIEKDIESQLKDLKITFDSEAKRTLKEYEGEVVNPKTQLMVVMQPDVLLKKLLVLANDVYTEFTLGADNYKIKGKILDESETMEFTINVMGVDQEVQCVDFKKQQGDALNFYKLIEEKFIAPLKIATGTTEVQEQETA
jgi:serine/threonine protein kinase